MDPTVEYIETAKQKIKVMLDRRKVEGDDVELEEVPDCPGCLWVIRRGNEYLVVFVKDISKGVATAICNYCCPEGEEVRYPHCVVVYNNKRTPMGARELQTYPNANIELFEMREVVRCPLDLKFQAEYTLMSPEEGQAILAKYEGVDCITTNDAVQRYFNAPIGSVYRTVERWGTLEPETRYRVVTAPTN